MSHTTTEEKCGMDSEWRSHEWGKTISLLGTIQVLRHQRGGWVGGVRIWQFLMIYSRGGWIGSKKV